MPLIMSVVGDLRPLRLGREDRLAIHLAQQGQQSVCESQEGIQGHLLAGRADPVLPICRPPKGMHHRAEMLHRDLQAGEGEAGEGGRLLHKAGRCNGDLDRSMGRAQPAGNNRPPPQRHNQVEKGV